jgi:hypothetical protein
MGGSSSKPAKYGAPGELGGLRGVAYSAALSAASNSPLLVATGTLEIHQYNAATADRRLRLRRPNGSLITSVAFCPNSPFGFVMLAGTQQGTVSVFALDSLK